MMLSTDKNKECNEASGIYTYPERNLQIICDNLFLTSSVKMDFTDAMATTYYRSISDYLDFSGD